LLGDACDSLALHRVALRLRVRRSAGGGVAVTLLAWFVATVVIMLWVGAALGAFE